MTPRAPVEGFSSGVNFSFVVGSVNFISRTIDHRTYRYLGGRIDR